MKQPQALAPLSVILSTARNALGTRFCHVCHDFRPIAQFRKGQNHVCQQHDEAPDPDGSRFCRVCQNILPLIQFPPGQKRYICRACSWNRKGKVYKAKYHAQRAHIQRLWAMCYTDLAAFQTLFHQPRVGVSQTDIAKLLEAGSFTASDAVKLAVMPQDPRRPMDKENAVVVTREQRRMLLSMLAAGGTEAYVNEMIGGPYLSGGLGTEGASE